MQVIAVSTRTDPDWRWQITNHAGVIIEESRETFPTIREAVAEGEKRLAEMYGNHRSLRRDRGRRPSHPMVGPER